MMKRNLFHALLCLLLVMTLVIAPVGASAAQKGIIMLLKTNVEGGRLREGPSSAYGVVRSLEKGEKVFYNGEKSEAFCLVRTTKGEIGYIYEGFLSPYGNVRADQVYYATANTYVYKSASTSGGRAGGIVQNQHVLVFKISGEWAFIKTLTGQGGFVKLSSLSAIQ